MKLECDLHEMRIVAENAIDRTYLQTAFHLTYPYATVVLATGSWISGDAGEGMIRLGPVECSCIAVTKGHTEQCEAHPAHKRRTQQEHTDA